MNTKPVKEVFSEDLAETISQHRTDNWTIENALSSEYTKFESNPPASLDKAGWTRKLSVTPSSTCSLIVRDAKQNYGLSSESEAIKKLSRYGLPNVWSEWIGVIRDAKQYSEAAACFSKYSKHSPDLLNLFQGKQQIKVNAGRSAPRQKQWRVIWYQKIIIKKISDTLGIHQSDVLRRVIFEAGSALRLREQDERVERIIADIDRQVESNIEDLKPPVYGALFTGLQGDRKRTFANKCQQDFPRVWDDLRSITSIVSEETYRQELQSSK